MNANTRCECGHPMEGHDDEQPYRCFCAMWPTYESRCPCRGFSLPQQETK
jgi:hypothetical protein